MFVQTGMSSPQQLNQPMMRARALERKVFHTDHSFQTPPINTSRFIWPQSVTAVVAFMVGTGGLLTADYVCARDGRGYRLQGFDYRAEQRPTANAQWRIRNSAENLSRARAVLKPTVTELASLFSVSRQAIYNWQAGHSVTHENEVRLEQIARAADILDAAGFSEKSTLLRRKLPGGSTFFEKVRSGESAETVAVALVAFVSRELVQRQGLATRLTNRLRPPLDIREVGTPHYNELA